MIQRFTAIALAAASRVTATGNGAAVDVSRFTGLSKLVLDASATEAADNTADVKLQHSADGATDWADLDLAVFEQVDNSGASLQELHLNADSLKKFVRVVDTMAGTDPAVVRSVTMIGKLAY